MLRLRTTTPNTVPLVSTTRCPATFSVVAMIMPWLLSIRSLFAVLQAPARASGPLRFA
jgi:hypothetical protein